MSKSAANQQLLLLLVRVYNQYIQYYYYFPDVVLCGNHRLEKMEFDFLLNEGLIMSFHTDSFGKLYRLSKKSGKFSAGSFAQTKTQALHTRFRQKKLHIFPFCFFNESFHWLLPRMHCQIKGTPMNKH